MSSSQQNWRLTSLGEIAKVTSGGTPSRKEPSYWSGDVPWISTSLIDFNVIASAEEYITADGVENSSAKVFPTGTLLMAMFGQGVTRGKVAVLGIDAAFIQACVGITPSKEVDAGYLYQFLAHNYEAIRQLSNSGSQENLNAGLIKGIQVPLPPLGEQKEIAAVVSTWDRSIGQLTELIAAKLRFKQGLVQQLVTGQRRFEGFRDEWRPVQLRDVTTESDERNRGQLGTDSVKAVTKAEGIVPMKERTIGADISRYLVVRKDWFAYNPMRLNIGSIARWRGDNDVLVSPDYVVFRCNDGNGGTAGIDPDYLDHLRRSEIWEKFVTAAGNGSVRVRIYFSDLGHLKFKLPSSAEQRRIASVLNAADREIGLLRKQRDAFKQQKKGLMQKLLTGEIRVKVSEGGE